MTLAPDEFQVWLYREEIEPNIKHNAALAFAHGLAIHHNQVAARADVGII
jgi:ketol-acid reductoisomerase